MDGGELQWLGGNFIEHWPRMGGDLWIKWQNGRQFTRGSQNDHRKEMTADWRWWLGQVILYSRYPVSVFVCYIHKVNLFPISFSLFIRAHQPTSGTTELGPWCFLNNTPVKQVSSKTAQTDIQTQMLGTVLCWWGSVFQRPVQTETASSTHTLLSPRQVSNGYHYFTFLAWCGRNWTYDHIWMF